MFWPLWWSQPPKQQPQVGQHLAPKQRAVHGSKHGRATSVLIVWSLRSAASREQQLRPFSQADVTEQDPEEFPLSSSLFRSDIYLLQLAKHHHALCVIDLDRQFYWK